MQTMIPLTAGEQEMKRGLVEDVVGRFRADLPNRKQDPNWIVRWLQGQHVGEINAVASMRALREIYAAGGADAGALRTVDAIVRDEERHVQMIEGLLRARGIEPRRPPREQILEGLELPERGSVIASRAEAVRAGEIRAVLEQEDTPADVREAFSAILRDETYHERTFRRIAGVEAMHRHGDCRNWCTHVDQDS